MPRRRRDATALSEPRSAAAAVLALQRTAGNSAATQLVEGAAHTEMVLDLPGVGDHIAVESLQLGTRPRGEVDGVTITRRIDANSPRFMRAAATGEPGTRATLTVGTPGSPRHLALRLEGCIVISYSPGGEWEEIGFSFTRVEFEQ